MRIKRKDLPRTDLPAVLPVPLCAPLGTLPIRLRFTRSNQTSVVSQQRARHFTQIPISGIKHRHVKTRSAKHCINLPQGFLRLHIRLIRVRQPDLDDPCIAVNCQLHSVRSFQTSWIVCPAIVCRFCAVIPKPPDPTRFAQFRRRSHTRPSGSMQYERQKNVRPAFGSYINQLTRRLRSANVGYTSEL